MNKTAIKNFAIWARNKLIADISYKAGLLGVTEKGIKISLPQSTQTVQFFDIGTKEPNSITGIEIQQRKKLVEEIERKAKQSDYTTAYKNVIEEVAYTWFNRLIAIRFMEVNDYLPTRIRALSSESNDKAEPDLVTHALEANLDYSAYEKDRIIQLKHENKLDELFRMLFIKQCNALNANLPELFEKTSDFTELLLNVSFTDKEGVVYHLVNDISEDDFNVSKEGQVEIIGWLYQYYNTEPKDEAFALLKKNVKITKDRVPAATQLFTPDWVVRYMVENSLGRLWLEAHPNDDLKSNWIYYLDEADQEKEVQMQIAKIHNEYKIIKPEDIKIIDPAMGSGHILVYAFDLLMKIYTSYGYSQRDAAKKIVEYNLFGLDIDKRAYQLAYFAVMMKARQYNRRILNENITCHIFVIQESNDINKSLLKYLGHKLSESDKKTAILQIENLIDSFVDAKEVGSILKLEKHNFDFLRKFVNDDVIDGQISIDTVNLSNTKKQLNEIIDIAEVITDKYDVAITNPPYMGGKGMSHKLSDYVKKHYFEEKSDLFSVFMKVCGLMVYEHGFFSMITQPSLLTLLSYESIRNLAINEQTIYSLLHMGRGIFGIDFGSTTFVIRATKIKNFNAEFYRLHDRTFQYIDPDDIRQIFLNAKRDNDYSYNFSEYNTKDELLDNNSDDKSKMIQIHYTAKPSNFSRIPTTPISYWVSDTVYSAFANFDNLIHFAEPRQGMATGDNNRFLKYWSEIDFSKIGFNIGNKKTAKESNYKWFPYNKGGPYRKWFGNNEIVVNWKDDGIEIRNFEGSVIRNPNYYFRQGLTWSSISAGSISFRFSSKGFLFDSKGPVIFAKNNINEIYLLALLNSKVAMHFLKVLAPTMDYNQGPIGRIPVATVTNEQDQIIKLATKNIEISKDDWDSFETSWDFQKHPLLLKNTIEQAYETWSNETLQRFKNMRSNEEELNNIFIKMYNLESEVSTEIDEDSVSVTKADNAKDIRSFLSYAVGCIFGRYSLDVNGIAYAGGKWNDELYTSFIPDKDNIIPMTDEEYFQDDLVGLLIKFLKKVYGEESLEANLSFIAQALGNSKNDAREVIRYYFLKEFFKDHCKVYQKRPIYWLFDSGKQNGFKALIYLHRYDENTIGNLRIDYLHRMQRIYENEIARMQDTIENSRDAREVTAATKRKEKLIKQLQETKEYDEKIAHLALARTSIDLDDGVKVNYEKVQTDRDGKKLDVLAKI